MKLSKAGKASAVIKGQVSFTLGGRDLSFGDSSISPFGVSGLAWGELSPERHFGQQVYVRIRLPDSGQVEFQLRAQIIREYRPGAESMGLKFEMDDEQRQYLAAFVTKQGASPGEYLRKYPRIPALESCRSFPIRAMVLNPAGVSKTSRTEYPIVFDVANLNPVGSLLFTQSPLALEIEPGQDISLVYEPRGPIHTQIKIEASVRFICDELSAGSGNLVRYVGTKFIEIEPASHNAFLEMMRGILSELEQG